MILKNLLKDVEIKAYIDKMKKEKYAEKVQLEQQNNLHNKPCITMNHNDEEIEYISIGHLKFRIK